MYINEDWWKRFPSPFCVYYKWICWQNTKKLRNWFFESRKWSSNNWSAIEFVFLETYFEKNGNFSQLHSFRSSNGREIFFSIQKRELRRGSNYVEFQATGGMPRVYASKLQKKAQQSTKGRSRVSCRAVDEFRSARSSSPRRYARTRSNPSRRRARHVPRDGLKSFRRVCICQRAPLIE